MEKLFLISIILVIIVSHIHDGIDCDQGDSTTNTPGHSLGDSTTNTPGHSQGDSTTNTPGQSQGDSTTKSPGHSQGDSSTKAPGQSQDVKVSDVTAKPEPGGQVAKKDGIEGIDAKKGVIKIGVNRTRTTKHRGRKGRYARRRGMTNSMVILNVNF